MKVQCNGLQKPWLLTGQEMSTVIQHLMQLKHRWTAGLYAQDVGQGTLSCIDAVSKLLKLCISMFLDCLNSSSIRMFI